jgi:CRISPR-associated protein (TIGR02584 family)
MQPHEYKKRILIAVSGLSPQILTETLYGLAVKQNFIPTEIHLITTLEGAHRATLNLLHEKTGKFHALCQEYQLPDIDFSEQHIHVIRDAQDNELNDIRTPEQNAAAADFITNTIKELTSDADSAVHVSIAGGRKTMGYYLGYALSLFGRTQDRLSHVLVSEGYEGHPEFYYPTLESHVIHTFDKKPLDTSKAEISLAEIPFIRMRQDIPKKLLQGKAGFLDTINLARKAELPPELIIDLENKKISANSEVFTMPAGVIAFYSWLLKQTIGSQEALEKPLDVEGNAQYAQDFITDYRAVVGEMGAEATENALSKGMEGAFFAEKITRINKQLKDNLGERLAKTYLIKLKASWGDVLCH